MFISKLRFLVKNILTFLPRLVWAGRCVYTYKYGYSRYYRQAYYLSQNILPTLGDFQKLYEEIYNPRVAELKTLCKVVPLNFNFLTPKEAVLNQRGVPRYKVYYQHPLFCHDVLFYKERINSIRLMTQFHFYDSKLWLVKQEVSYRTQKDCDKVLDLLFSKYAIEGWSDKCAAKSIRVRDSLGNTIFITVDFKIEIVYASFEGSILDTVRALADKLTRNTERDEQIIKAKLLKNL